MLDTSWVSRSIALYELVPKGRWHRGHTVVIGDAAHALSQRPARRNLGDRRRDYPGQTGPPSARDEANSLLLKHIQEVPADSRGTYGWPRAPAELTLGRGLPVNHQRVARLMRQTGLQGLYRRRYRRGATGPATEDDLVQRRFTVEAPHRQWLTDSTDKRRQAVLRSRDGHLRSTHRRMVHCRSHAHRARRRCTRHGHTPPTPRNRFGDPALRPRLAILMLLS